MKAQKKVPFRVVRMVFDFTVIVIAWVFGAKIGLVTILMGFTLARSSRGSERKWRRFLMNEIGISERMVYNISNFVIERKRRTDNESSI